MSQMFLLEKDHLKLACSRRSLPVSPSLSVRLPHSSSTPVMTLSAGVHSRLAEAYWPLWKALASWKFVLSTLVKL